MAEIIVIEDEMTLRRSIRRRLEQEGHSVSDVENLTDARRLVQEGRPEVIITDLNLGQEDGLDMVRELRRSSFEGSIIVMTAFGTVESAVEAIKDGADEYLQKPLSLEELCMLVERVIKRRRLQSRLNLYERIDRYTDLERPILGQSTAWKQTMTTADRLAQLPRGTMVLLAGETGVGKGTLARYIHKMSAQRSGAFVHIKCYALPANVMENELFGAGRSSFADSEPLRPGLFDQADEGTIFLDEICEIPLPLQSKLLAVIEQAADRSGSGMRLMASTAHDLDAKVEAGDFRRDLYYAMNILRLEIPTLADRGEDVVLLAQSFLDTAMREVGRSGLSFSPGALHGLHGHTWPGNVRELANVVQRAVLLAPAQEITAADLGLGGIAAQASASASGTARAIKKTRGITTPDEAQFDFSSGPISVEELEKRLIVQALREARGNVSRAAKLIDMTRSSLRYRIERLKLDDLVRELQAT